MWHSSLRGLTSLWAQHLLPCLQFRGCCFEAGLERHPSSRLGMRGIWWMASTDNQKLYKNQRHPPRSARSVSSSSFSFTLTFFPDNVVIGLSSETLPLTPQAPCGERERLSPPKQSKFDWTPVNLSREPFLSRARAASV